MADVVATFSWRACTGKVVWRVWQNNSSLQSSVEATPAWKNCNHLNNFLVSPFALNLSKRKSRDHHNFCCPSPVVTRNPVFDRRAGSSSRVNRWHCPCNSIPAAIITKLGNMASCEKQSGGHDNFETGFHVGHKPAVIHVRVTLLFVLS